MRRQKSLDGGIGRLAPIDRIEFDLAMDNGGATEHCRRPLQHHEFGTLRVDLEEIHGSTIGEHIVQPMRHQVLRADGMKRVQVGKRRVVPAVER
ncbi:hypothetical protein SAMN07250955_106252 [Arboricoccus pini]|uniref:Uncharacterized protein n=1 Tax=Arboricoccus pini TaxID=1963835 RepID=A0A212R9E0_9PROT|nr:hypothetical protein SAMN07250955_106252 [Arboricoccus pini]